MLTVWNFLPNLNYLLYTSWGKWLITKVVLSLLIAVTAFLIRIKLKKGDHAPGSLLKVDVGLLAAIVLTVGVLTYQTPLPHNEPLHFHKMGTDMTTPTLLVSPNAPGRKRVFILKIWLKDSVGKGIPKSVKLRLLPIDREDVGFIWNCYHFPPI